MGLFGVSEKELKTIRTVFEEMENLKDEDLSKPSDDLAATAVEWYQDNAEIVFKSTYGKSPGNIGFKKTMLHHSTLDYGAIPRGNGRLYAFAYEPEKEHKDKTYWDMFPLVLKMMEADERRDSFLGINLHYLDPERRKLAFLSLVEDYASGDLKNRSTRISFLNAPKLSRVPARYFRPCIRRYKFSNIRGRALLIPPEHWMKMIFLPTYQFVGAWKSKVWKDTWSKYKKSSA